MVDDAARRRPDFEAHSGDRLEWRVERLEDWRKDMAALNPQLLQFELQNVRKDLAELAAQVDRQRKVANAVLMALIAAALSFAFMAVTIAATG